MCINFNLDFHVGFDSVNQADKTFSKKFFLFIFYEFSLCEAGQVVSEKQDFLNVSLDYISIEEGSRMFRFGWVSKLSILGEIFLDA